MFKYSNLKLQNKSIEELEKKNVTLIVFSTILIHVLTPSNLLPRLKLNVSLSWLQNIWLTMANYVKFSLYTIEKFTIKKYIIGNHEHSIFYHLFESASFNHVLILLSLMGLLWIQDNHLSLCTIGLVVMRDSMKTSVSVCWMQKHISPTFMRQW